MEKTRCSQCPHLIMKENHSDICRANGLQIPSLMKLPDWCPDPEIVREPIKLTEEEKKPPKKPALRLMCMTEGCENIMDLYKSEGNPDGLYAYLDTNHEQFFIHPSEDETLITCRCCGTKFCI